MDDKKKTFKKNTRAPNAFAQAGKLPPQALNLEEAVLGALMLDKDAVALIIDILRPASFYKEAHEHIYKAICNLFEKSHPIDLLTVTEELKTIGKLNIIGGPYQLVELTNRVASSANIEFHARIIAQKFIQRELIRTSTEVINSAFEDTIDVFDLLDTAEQNLFNITEQNLSRGSLGMSTLVNMAVKQLEEMAGKEEGLTGVPTGFVNLDKLTSGWQPSDLIIVAARPGMGKCLAKGTKVLLYDGRLREVERIKTGDLLMGDDSTPRKVLNIARGQEQMYWIHQDQAMSYRVNASHILSLRCVKSTGDYQYGEVLNIAVKDWLQHSETFQACFQGYKVGVDFSQTPELLPAYWVGLHLAPLLSEWQTIPKKVSSNRGSLEERVDFSQTHHLSQLRDYCLQQKRLPKAYLWGSASERLELLAGWVDVLGSYWPSEQRLVLDLNNAPLAKQLKFVADSLGFWTKLEQEDNNYRLIIGGQLMLIPSRRHDLNVPSFRTITHRCSAIQVEKDQVDDYYGFTLDANNLFLLEDMTVTHNTSFTMAVARNAAIDFNKGVAFFSLEMSSLQLVNRLISMETEIPSEKLRKGQLEDFEWQQLHSQVDKLSKVPLFIDDTPGISIFELRAKCRRLKMQHDIQMVVVDYLQLMTGGGDNKGNREQEISMISRGLKGLAKELSVPVIALSQLSRAVETRGGSKRPQLSDLRECITGDTLIYKADSGTYQRVDELVDQKGFQVLAINEQQKLEKDTCLDVWETGEKDIFEVTTQAGFKIKTSANHPFYTINGWKKLEELEAGDFVATPRQIDYDRENPAWQDEEIILLAHTIGLGLSAAHSHEKQVPKTIFSSSKRQVALFIHHVLATDSGIFISKTKSSSKIHYSSNSIGLVQDLQILLLRFGISASINSAQKENDKPSYTLNITGKNNILTFCAAIGIHENKCHFLKELTELYQNKNTVPNSDISPKDSWKAVRALRKKKNLAKRQFQDTLEPSYSSSNLYKNNISSNRLTQATKNLNLDLLIDWADSGIKWEKIVSIEPLGRAMTYDIHVEKHHNFVANNFIVHNSGAIEQDADIVSFIYRPEYYQILEDEEGNSLKGIGEIIVAKHRNGALDSIKLKWDGQYAKFSNLDDDAFTGLDDASFFDQAPDQLSGETFLSKMNEGKENKNNGIDDVPF